MKLNPNKDGLKKIATAKTAAASFSGSHNPAKDNEAVGEASTAQRLSRYGADEVGTRLLACSGAASVRMCRE